MSIKQSCPLVSMRLSSLESGRAPRSSRIFSILPGRVSPSSRDLFVKLAHLITRRELRWQTDIVATKR